MNSHLPTAPKPSKRSSARGVDEGRARLPASRVSNAGRRIPGNGDDLVESFLNPDGVMVGEMNDCAQRLSIIEVVLKC